MMSCCLVRKANSRSATSEAVLPEIGDAEIEAVLKAQDGGPA